MRNEGTDGTDPNCWGRYCGDSSVCPLIIPSLLASVRFVPQPWLMFQFSTHRRRSYLAVYFWSDRRSRKS